MGITELEQLLVFAPVALTPAEGWESNYSFSELVVGPSTDCLLLAPHSQFPPDIATKTAPPKETPASLFLQGPGDSLASERIAKCCCTAGALTLEKRCHQANSRVIGG